MIIVAFVLTFIFSPSLSLLLITKSFALSVATNPYLTFIFLQYATFPSNREFMFMHVATRLFE